MGFHYYLFNENHYDSISASNHATDAELFPELRRIYEEETAGDKPCFSFSVTFQNHSLYDAIRINAGEYVSREGLSDAAYYAVNNYLAGIADTGRRISAYVDSFRDDEEPVFHRDFMFMENGVLTTELSDKAKQAYQDYLCVQYALRRSCNEYQFD